MGKTILVTGGAGFIGSHLCERLVAEGHKVISLDNYFTGSRDNHIPGVEYREGHTKDIERLIPESPDLIYHLGEYSRVEKSFEDIENVWNLNQFGTFAVAEFWRRRGGKLVYAGSSTKFSDEGLGRNQSPYAWSKASMTDLVVNYGTWFSLPYAVTYFYNVYGPRERSDAYGTVVEIFRQQRLRGLPLTLVSPGTQVRIFTHVNDIVEGLLLVGEKGEGNGYGIGGKDAHTMRELAQLFGGDTVLLPERIGNRQTASIDTSKTRALGWAPKQSLSSYISQALKEAPPQAVSEKRILVFATTFHESVDGPAERALCTLMEHMPDVHFDIVAARYQPDAHLTPCVVPNATVHYVGTGTPFDKFLLPFLGVPLAMKLAQTNTYLFAWSLMASYGTIPALFVRHRAQLPLLVTLADQQLSWRVSLFLRFVMRGADQVYASLPEQGRKVASLTKRMSAQKSLGAGDSFANAIRFAYSSILTQTSKKVR